MSHQMDRFSITSAVVGIGKTREEYLKLFSRACISPINDRPYVTPIPGLYDTMNTSTSLILLNQRYKTSHLREPALLEELSYSSRRGFDYESWIEIQRTKQKSKNKKKTRAPNILIDPYRHFESKSRRKSKRSHSMNAHAESLVFKRDSFHEEPQPSLMITQTFQNNCNDAVVDNDKPNILDTEKHTVKQPSNERLKSSTTRQKLPLTQDQQLVLLDKYQIYDMKDTKVRRNNSYSQTLNDRLKADFNCKPQFRLNDSRDYSRYAKFLPISRSYTPSSITMKPNDNKTQSIHNNHRKSYTTCHNKIPLMPLRIQQ